jgi:hypothetical protein
MNKRRGKPPKLPGYTHEAEQAKLDGVEVSTLQARRARGCGQAWIKFNRWVYYVDADRPRYLESLKRIPVRGEERAV